MSETHRVIVFKNTFLTFKAERALKKAGIACKVVTKPRHVSSDCGLAIRFDTDRETDVRTLMDDHGIEFLGVW
jgi:Putative Se/S carrier protein-like